MAIHTHLFWSKLMTRKHDQFISDANTDYLNTRIKELEVELDWWVELARREIKEDCPNLPAYIKKMRADLATANATIAKLRKACPQNLECNDFHHSPKDYHRGGECGPLARYKAALAAAGETPDAN